MGKRRLTLPVLEKTLELLDTLTMGGEHLPIGVLAERLHLSRNNVLLLLVTLESHGIVRWDGTARVYQPGSRAVEMARQFLNLSGAAVAEQRAGTASRKTRPHPAGTMKLRTSAGLR
jgi:DNA-binding IclR family transcriptional regulator